VKAHEKALMKNALADIERAEAANARLVQAAVETLREDPDIRVGLIAMLIVQLEAVDVDDQLLLLAAALVKIAEAEIARGR
jgi:hypothetical protein